jgi:hypothetical protein
VTSIGGVVVVDIDDVVVVAAIAVAVFSAAVFVAAVFVAAWC